MLKCLKQLWSQISLFLSFSLGKTCKGVNICLLKDIANLPIYGIKHPYNYVNYALMLCDFLINNCVLMKKTTFLCILIFKQQEKEGKTHDSVDILN